MRVKNTKGITLVALIMTIVVLLILSVVAITAISDTELVTKTNSAVNQWQQAEKNEGDTLNSYLDFINTYSGGCEHTNYSNDNYALCLTCGHVCVHGKYDYNYMDATGDYRASVCGTCGKFMWWTEGGPYPHEIDSATGMCKNCKKIIN